MVDKSLLWFGKTQQSQEERAREARYAFRTSQWLEECQVAPALFEPVLPRLYTFMKPFVTVFHGEAAAQHATLYGCGLLSDVARKHSASMAARFGPSRLPLQGFIGWDAWDEAPVREEVRGHVKTHVGQGDGVVVCEPSGGPTSGRESVGVARPWGGRLGKVEHCQVAIALGDVSSKGHPLVDTRRYRPKAWTKETARLDQAGGPKARRGYRTRPQVAVEMLEKSGDALPHRGMAGDDEMGRPDGLRRRLAASGEREGLAGPSNTARRDLATAPPE